MFSNYIFANAASWSEGTFSGATVDLTNSVVNFSSSGGSWTSQVIDLQNWNVNNWSTYAINITLSPSVTYSFLARTIDVPTDTTTAFSVQSSGTFALTTKRYVQFLISTNGAAQLSQLSVFWTNLNALHADSPFAFIANGFTTSYGISVNSVELINYETNNIADSISFNGNIINFAKSLNLNSDNTNIINFNKASVPNNSTGLINNFIRTTLGGVNITSQILPSTTMEQLAVNIFDDPTGYYIDSTYSSYKKIVQVPGIISDNTGYVVLEMGVHYPTASPDSNTGIFDPSRIGTLTLTLNGGTPIDIKPYMSTDLDNRVNRVMVPVSGIIVGSNILRVDLTPIGSEILVMGIDNTYNSASYGITNLPYTEHALTGELKSWIYSTTKRPIINSGSFANYISTATVYRPYAAILSSSTVIGYGKIDIATSSNVKALFDTISSSEVIRPRVDIPSSSIVAHSVYFSSSANVVKAYIQLQSNSYVTSPINIPSTANIKYRVSIPSSATTIKPHVDFASYSHVSIFKDLYSSAYVTSPILISSSANVSRIYVDLNSQSYVATPGRVNYTSSSIVMVRGKTDFISNTIVRPASTDFTSNAIVSYGKFYNSSSQVSKPEISILSESLVVNYKTLDITSNSIVDPAGNIYVPSSASVLSVKNIDITSNSNVIYIKPTLDTYSMANVIPGVVVLIKSTSYILYRTDFNSNSYVERRNLSIPSLANVISDKIGSLADESIYFSDLDFASLDIMQILELPQVYVTESLQISGTDSYTYAEIDIIYPNPMKDIVNLIGFDSTPGIYTDFDINANWSSPVKLTNNIFLGESVSSPAIGEIDGILYVAYEVNENLGDENSIHVVKNNDISSYSNWQPAKRLSGQKPSFSNSEFQYTGKDGVYEWTPPDPGSELYAPEITFVPLSRLDHTKLNTDFEYLTYQQQVAGEIIYPPPEWGFNPINEFIGMNAADGSMTNPDMSLSVFSSVTNANYYIMSEPPFLNGIIILIQTMSSSNIGS